MDPEIAQELKDMAEAICELCQILTLMSDKIDEINTKIGPQFELNPN